MLMTIAWNICIALGVDCAATAFARTPLKASERCIDTGLGRRPFAFQPCRGSNENTHLS